jgi:hypothetical protein
MPLAGPILGGLIAKEFASVGFSGTQSLSLAMAIGTGIVVDIQSKNFYQGQSVGIGTGAGVGTGTIKGIVGPTVGTLIYGFMFQNNLTGTKARDLANAIGNAFANHIVAGIVTSASIPVANGTGIGMLKGIVGISVAASIYSFMKVFGLTGTQSANLSFAIGDGIAAAIKAGIVQTTIVGGGYPPSPTSGTDIGKMV